MTDIAERLLEGTHPEYITTVIVSDTLREAAAELKRLQELLRGVGANRYWEGRWRDEAAEVKRLTAEHDVWKIACNAQAAEVARLRRLLLHEAASAERLAAEVDRLQSAPDLIVDRQKAFDDGIAFERERCAKLAEIFSQIQLAAAIRKGH